MIPVYAYADARRRITISQGKRGARQRILLEPCEKLDAEQVALFAAEAEDLGRFLNVNLELRVASG